MFRCRHFLHGSSVISFAAAACSNFGELLHWDGLDEEAAELLGVELIEGRASAKADSHPTEEVLRRIGREYRIAEKTFRRYSGHTLRMLRHARRELLLCLFCPHQYAL